MLRITLLIFFYMTTSTASIAGDLTTYWNSANNYGIAYPSEWKPDADKKFIENDAFVVGNNQGDLGINVMAKKLSVRSGEHYRSITDIPNAKEELSSFLKSQFHIISIDSGKTQLSSEPSLWFAYTFVHKALDKEVWFYSYQISCLKNDTIYTITAKVSGLSQNQAKNKYDKYWSLISTIITSFYFV
jgi:hypothetical protein